MILFFSCNKEISVKTQDFEQTFEHKFEANPENFLNKSYFTTPSDFQFLIKDVKDVDDTFKLLDPEVVSQYLPVNLGFLSPDEFQKRFEKLNNPKIAVINAMSSAFGDYLIGMRAFEYWASKINATINFFQLNPFKVYPITKQSKYVSNIYMLPNKMSVLMEHDAFIDFGAFVLKENCDNQPMIDFFLEGFSIDPKTVPDSYKRIKFHSDVPSINSLFEILRFKKKPILLFHRSSSSKIRDMKDPVARKLIKDVIDNSDYMVISVDNLDFSYKNFVDMSHFSSNIEAFASIISNVDAIVTVDTSTYHFADAFNIPTVVLFTTINPEYRIKYYPNTRAIMLETSSGPVYGKHQSYKEEDEKYVEGLWEKVDAFQILKQLERKSCVELF